MIASLPVSEASLKDKKSSQADTTGAKSLGEPSATYSGRYTAPQFVLDAGVDQERYKRWVFRRAVAHAKRDKRRSKKSRLRTETAAAYRMAIHTAVIRSGGLDEYTSEPLDWHLIGTYDNTESSAHGAEYKQRFAKMPTVDHVHGPDNRPKWGTNLKICSWQLNDAKNDLAWDSFLELCRRVVAIHGIE